MSLGLTRSLIGFYFTQRYDLKNKNLDKLKKYDFKAIVTGNTALLSLSVIRSNYMNYAKNI